MAGTIGPFALDEIHRTDALRGIRKLPDECIDCVMTSPPYWSMRDYGIPPTAWPDGSSSILGLETSFDEYVRHLCNVFADVHRVLKKKGTLWVNLGDVYTGSWGNYAPNGIKGVQRPRSARGTRWARPGYGSDTSLRPPTSSQQSVPRKSLSLIPERFAIAMVERGWILRNRIVWYKPNHMPSSVKDRFTNAWESIFFFVKSQRYSFDLDAVREPHKTQLRSPDYGSIEASWRASPNPHGRRLPPCAGKHGAMHENGKNPADFWSVTPETRTLGAITGTNGAVKVPGGAGWTGHPLGGQARIIREQDTRWLSPAGKNPGDVISLAPQRGRRAATDAPTAIEAPHFAVYPEALCERPIRAGCPAGGIVLDPFIGSGTTAVVAKRLGRKYVGFDIHPRYVAMAKARLARVMAGPENHAQHLKGGGAQRVHGRRKAKAAA